MIQLLRKCLYIFQLKVIPQSVKNLVLCDNWNHIMLEVQAGKFNKDDCYVSMECEGRVSWRKQLAHRRRDSQSGHSSMARFPQLEHAWRSNEEGDTCDERYHRDGVLFCIQYSPCRVVFQSVLRARLLLE